MPLNEAGRANGVLVVDDDESVRMLLERLLEDAGYHVECASDGGEALRRLEAEPPPDLMILDLMMPGISGWDVIDFIEDRPRLASVAVVVLTAYGEDADAGRPIIHKPVDGDLLRSLVRELVPVRAGSFDGREPPSDLLPRGHSRESRRPA